MAEINSLANERLELLSRPRKTDADRERLAIINEQLDRLWEQRRAEGKEIGVAPVRAGYAEETGAQGFGASKRPKAPKLPPRTALSTIVQKILAAPEDDAPERLAFNHTLRFKGKKRAADDADCPFDDFAAPLNDAGAW